MVATQGPPDALGLVGSTIDQVRFDACVDAGGFGLIYRGFHEGLGETVAIKCLRIASIQKTNEAIREALAGRFRDETKLLYRLSQGNLDIVRCISSGTLVAPKTKEYTPYMVLEWLDGCTLSTELKERRDRKLGVRNLDQAVQLLDSAVGGIAYAHSHDVVHRDVKPGNLFLTRTREGVRMKVLDFGLAKILSDEAIGVRPSVETGIGVHFCSPSYGAPEQFTSSIGKIGPSTDVYSLTLVLFEVLRGEKVRPANNLADGLMKALDEKTGSPTATDLGLELPAAVEALLRKAVAQNPADRPHDAGVFWSLLKDAMTRRSGEYGATVADDAMTSAMQQVRDQAVLRAAQNAQPSPFAGTMLMQNAPSGAPHLVAHPSSPLPSPLPAAGRAATAALSLDGPIPNTTSPLSPPLPQPQSSPDSERLARARDEHMLKMKMTMPLGAHSPLATSLAIPSPLHNASTSAPAPAPAPASHPPPAFSSGSGSPPASYAQQPQQPQGTQPIQSYPPVAARPPRSETATDPRMGITTEKRRTGGSGGLFAMIGACVVVLLGFAYYWFRVRGH